MSNHSAWPARIENNVSFRYYATLPSGPDGIQIRVDYDQSSMYSGEGVTKASISSWKLVSGSTYYIEVNYPDGRAMLPVGAARHQCEMQIYFGGTGWDTSTH